MNPQIEKLHTIAGKDSRMIIGLMSGTSLDGLDVALCRFVGNGLATKVDVIQFATVPFEDEIKVEIRKVFAQKNIDFPLLCQLNPWIANLHAGIINSCLAKWNISSEKVDIIASHGQTVMHTPKRLHRNDKFPNGTLQIGDGDHIAVKTGIITVSDFRQKHCALGGEGAPMALYGDFLLFSDLQENRILINIGGIANFTWLPANKDINYAFATDTGPGNTLIDAFCKKYFNLDYDKGAEIALTGKCNHDLLDALLQNEYFAQTHPKTTGPELLNLEYLEKAQLKSDSMSETPENVLNTLTHFTARTLSDYIKKSIETQELGKSVVYLSGGGMHNPLISDLLKQFLPVQKMENMGVLGVSGDAKEAVLFAALANESLAGEMFSYGKISFPA